MLKRLFSVDPVPELSAEESAGRYFDRGDNCAQAVLKAICGDVDRQLLEVAKSFGAGIAGAKCLCGAISGGVMALSLRDQGKRSDQLVTAFRQRYRTTCCAGLSKDFTWKSREHRQNCRQLTVSVAQIVERMLSGKEI